MYHRHSFYPELIPEYDKVHVERHIVDVSTGVETFDTVFISFSDTVEFNPNFKGLHADSFSINSAVKSGSPLKPSPSIRIMDMSLSDEANRVFNSKIANNS